MSQLTQDPWLICLIIIKIAHTLSPPHFWCDRFFKLIIYSTHESAFVIGMNHVHKFEPCITLTRLKFIHLIRTHCALLLINPTETFTKHDRTCERTSERKKNSDTLNASSPCHNFYLWYMFCVVHCGLAMVLAYFIVIVRHAMPFAYGKRISFLKSVLLPISLDSCFLLLASHLCFWSVTSMFLPQS